MKKIIQKFIKLSFKSIIWFLLKFKVGNYLISTFLTINMDQEYLVTHKNVTLKLSVPNGLTYLRAKTFSVKEPETLDWIDGFNKNSIFWDIGCNVGLYSVYAAKKKHIVYGFEPSFFNLEIIARNIHINNLSKYFYVMPIALNDYTKMSELKLTSTVWGSAHSTFDKNISQDGTKIKEKIVYNTLGFSIDELCSTFKLPSPDYIKIDVDGIEHLILEGGKETLVNTKSILIENANIFYEQSKGIEKILNEIKFDLLEEFKITEDYKNQIWVNRRNV